MNNNNRNIELIQKNKNKKKSTQTKRASKLNQEIDIFDEHNQIENIISFELTDNDIVFDINILKINDFNDDNLNVIKRSCHFRNGFQNH